jgi:ribosomal protein S27AE
VTETEGEMVCPRCGVEMNHHADKLVHGGESEPNTPDELTLSGFIEEFHTCPQCGGGASRHA